MSETDDLRAVAYARGRQDGMAAALFVALCFLVGIPASGGRMLEHPWLWLGLASAALVVALAALSFTHRRAGRAVEAAGTWRGGAAGAMLVLAAFGGLRACSETGGDLMRSLRWY
ncbi:MAG TPA: hypothetical protein VFL14_03560 [Xanthomonadales bacterium]|nr:hypothetical protein [Xanthomonadales bacterium]